MKIEIEKNLANVMHRYKYSRFWMLPFVSIYKNYGLLNCMPTKTPPNMKIIVYAMNM